MPYKAKEVLRRLLSGQVLSFADKADPTWSCATPMAGRHT